MPTALIEKLTTTRLTGRETSVLAAFLLQAEPWPAARAAVAAATNIHPANCSRAYRSLVAKGLVTVIHNRAGVKIDTNSKMSKMTPSAKIDTPPVSKLTPGAKIDTEKMSKMTPSAKIDTPPNPTDTTDSNNDLLSQEYKEGDTKKRDPDLNSQKKEPPKGGSQKKDPQIPQPAKPTPSEKAQQFKDQELARAERIFKIWNAAEHTITHRAFSGKTRDRVLAAVNGACGARSSRSAGQGYTESDIINAIAEYNHIIGNPKKYYFSYAAWTLDLFLNRGLGRFVPDAKPRDNFLKDDFRTTRKAGRPSGTARNPESPAQAQRKWKKWQQ